ncbi:NAD(P)-dependent alcohol dehydrogenase [Leptospira wolffii]|uniref:zinc-dependent alcohol dehydrogenase family protein n=1 Tax=Leptospira wolffii TaxID=409998 RepID=UPI000345403F|nr:NAD(P)-dependent alcohol dehydrogenase [Leptospira wolffii]TGK62210.1 NAD(P)-dependent alcohol dehydrogenase [Leptospira wolffii]TGK66581.1 NAD(P)-dependent alcohol dehydrogenase [Leptospira wolffii]TGK74406.1 NAD(P)-dependent alcohol dehydrogenase [Leptospira wolffii]TGL32019.1 NAD(P)-dependent alcohol dehydrogenase [Leptospira wolffii]
MKAIRLSAFGKENLSLTDLPDPKNPGPGEVLVRFRAASLNFRDYLVVQGKYNPNFPVPMVPCSDGSGEIVQVGEGVSDWKPGDKVNATFAPYWLNGAATKHELRTTLGGPLDGTLREYAILPATGVVPMPTHLSFEEAATLPCAALTAWSSFFVESKLKQGESVVVQGTGGVSLFALQFAKQVGATVYLTSSSDEKLERGKELGADFLINYKENPAWGKKIRELTGGEGADHIVEVGGAGTLEQSLQAVKLFGTVHLIGILSGSIKDLNLLPIVMNQIKVQGIVVGHRAAFLEMNRAIESWKLRPVVDKIFELGEFREALDYLKDGKHFGKIVVRVS